MQKASFVEYLSSITTLSAAFKDELMLNLQVEKYTGHQIINAAGQTENRLWFINEGFVRAYYFDREGKQRTLKFYSENDLIFSYNGFWKEASEYYLESLQSSTMLSLSYKNLNKLFKYLETGDLIKMFIIQQQQKDNFKLMLMNETSKDRCRHFRETHPEIFRKTSAGLIASYLNVTREYLSRLTSADFK